MARRRSSPIRAVRAASPPDTMPLGPPCRRPSKKFVSNRLRTGNVRPRPLYHDGTPRRSHRPRSDSTAWRPPRGRFAASSSAYRVDLRERPRDSRGCPARRCCPPAARTPLAPMSSEVIRWTGAPKQRELGQTDCPPGPAIEFEPEHPGQPVLDKHVRGHTVLLRAGREPGRRDPVQVAGR